MEKKKKLFGNGKFYGMALSLAVPIMIQQLIQSLVSLIDNFMVSGLGDVSMSGVNVAGQVLFCFMIYLNTICMTGGIFLTQFFGAAEKEGMQQAFRFKLIMGFAAFIPFFLVCMVYPRQVMSLLLIGNSEAGLILDEAVKYMRIVFFMGIPMTISVSIASSLRDMGDVKTPLYITVVATLTNTFFNYLLIYGNLGMPRLEVKGAAIATVIARVVEVILFIIIYIRKKPEFAFKINETFKVDWPLFRRILKKGLMILFSEMVWVLSETLTTAIYNGRGGADVVSGMSSSFAIANLFFVSFAGIYSATGVILGKTLGEGNIEKARRESIWLRSGAFIFGISMTFFGLATTLLIPVVFSRLSLSAIGIIKNMVILMAAFMPVWVCMNAQMAIARAGGDTAMGTYTDASLTIFLMIPMVLILGIYTKCGPVMLYGLVKCIDVIKIVVFRIWLKKERWLKNLTVA